MINFIKAHKVSLIISSVLLICGATFFFFGSYFFQTDNSGNTNNISLGDIDTSKTSIFRTPQYVVVRINSISSDEVNYYISYTYQSKKDVNQLSWDEYTEGTISASKGSVTEADLGSYVSHEIAVKFNKPGVSIDENNIQQQIGVVLATPDWEAPPAPTTDSNSGGGGDTNRNINPHTPNSGSNNSSNDGTNSNQSNSNSSTDAGNSQDSNSPPLYTTPDDSASSPSVYYPPYDGPPRPDVDNENSPTPLPQ